MRPIDADAFEKAVLKPNMFDINKDDVIALIAEMPTLDVVPKSEVENLRMQLEIKETAYDALRELYHIDTDALIEARRKAEVNVARKIFAVTDILGTYNPALYAELKKEYTEDE